MYSIFKDRAGDSIIDKNQFTQAAQLIEVSRIQAQLVADVVRTEIQRNRQKYQYEADVWKAVNHKNAARFGYKTIKEDGSSVVCPCCSLKISTQPLPLCYSTTDTDKLQQDSQAKFKLDSGIALFLGFIKSLILYLIIKFLLTDAFNLYSNFFAGNACQHSSQCAKIFWNYLSTSNKQNRSDLIMIHDILNLVCIIFSIIFFIFLRKKQYRFYDIIDRNIQTEDDFTIMVCNIPTLDFPKQSQQSAKNVQFFYRRHLENYFEEKVQQWLNDQRNWKKPSQGSIQFDFQALRHQNGGQLRSPQVVKSITLCYNLSRLQTIEQTRQQLIEQFLQQKSGKKQNKQQLKKNTQKNPSMKQYESGVRKQFEQQPKGRFSSLLGKIDFLNDCQIVLNKQYANDNSVLFNMTHFVGIAFVSFQYQHYRDFILMQSSTDDKFLQYNGNYLQVQPAAHPSQVYWTNLRVTKKNRQLRAIISYLILVMVLVFAFIFLSGAQIMKQTLHPQQPEIKIQFLSLLQNYWAILVATLFILAINYGLSITIHSLTRFQKHQTRTNENISLIIKLVIYQFINTGLIYYAISLVKPWYSPGEDKYTDNNGLVSSMCWIVTFSTIIQIILNALYLPDLWRRVKVWWNYRKLSKTDKVETFQIKLNRQLELPAFDLADWYSFFILQLFISSFYSYLVPVIVPIIIIGTFIQFWLVKIILFRRSSLYYTFNFNLTRSIRKVFESSIFLFAAGNFLFAWHLKDAMNIFNIIGLGIASLFLLFIIFVPQKLERRILGQYQRCQKHIYDDCVADGKFYQTYWKQNPATCLVKESDLTGRKMIFNPVQKINFGRQQDFVSDKIK